MIREEDHERTAATLTPRVLVNPYRRQDNNRNDNQPKNNNPSAQPHQHNNLLDGMPQSQWRKSSITGCKQKATLFKGPRTHAKSTDTTNSQRACKVCKVKEYNALIAKQINEATLGKASQEDIRKLRLNLKKVPHRAHVNHCSQNKSKNHKSNQSLNNVGTNDLAKRHSSNNGLAPLFAIMNNSLPHASAINNEVSVPIGDFPGMVPGNGTTGTTTIDSFTLDRWKSTPMASELRNELEKRMVDQLYLDRFKACRAPLAVAVLVEYIDSTFQYKRPKYQNLPDSDIFIGKYDQYRRFFQPGSIAFTFPPERRDRVPFPQYHAIEGTTYLHVDWTMSHPDVPLRCVESTCTGRLVRDRYAYQKSKTLLPILHQQHPCIWANVMKYLCDTCSERCAGNDGRLLAALPAQVARCYPVKPKYCGASSQVDRSFFQLSVELSEDLEDNILTYANAGVFSRKIWKRVLREYERRALDYYSVAKTIGTLQGP